MKKGILYLLGIILTTSAVRSQELFGVIELIPVPRYPGDNSINLEPSLKDKGVFYDGATQEIVISYLDPQQPGGRRVLRFQRRNQTQPAVTSAVSKRQDGTYLYEYSVLNALNASKKIDVFCAVLGR